MNAGSVLINFEAQAAGTVISDQFAAQGIEFEGLEPVVTDLPPGQLPDGTHVLDISYCPACEFPVADLVGRFTWRLASEGIHHRCCRRHPCRTRSNSLRRYDWAHIGRLRRPRQ
jgi:hypothetical protein